MNEQQYNDDPELVAALKKHGPVVIDESVPDGQVRISADVDAEHALRVHQALAREIAAVQNAIDALALPEVFKGTEQAASVGYEKDRLLAEAERRFARNPTWDWKAEAPNPALSGPPRDKK